VNGTERERTPSAAIAAIVTIGTMSSADGTASGLTPSVLERGSLSRLRKKSRAPRTRRPAGLGSQGINRDDIASPPRIAEQFAFARLSVVEITKRFLVGSRFVVAKGSALRQPIDAAIESLEADGTLEQSRQRWFGSVPV
jgi:hypothetical protein